MGWSLSEKTSQIGDNLTRSAPVWLIGRYWCVTGKQKSRDNCNGEAYRKALDYVCRDLRSAGKKQTPRTVNNFKPLWHFWGRTLDSGSDPGRNLVKQWNGENCKSSCGTSINGFLTSFQCPSPVELLHSVARPPARSRHMEQLEVGVMVTWAHDTGPNWA